MSLNEIPVKNVTPADATSTIPKTIWMMWLQGLDNAPYVVQKCYDSWKRLNPGWDVVFLDETNYRDYVDIQAVLDTDNKIEIQARANLIRIHLLAAYGGVWADATCLCRVPLDDWLEKHARAGFFAFDRPHRARLMDNWFIASSKDCYLTKKLRDEVVSYWMSNTGLRRRRDKVTAGVLTLLTTNTHTTRFTFSYPVRKLLKAYPYHWFMYLFTELVRTDPRFRQIWAETGKISADLPHMVQHVGMLSPLTEDVKRQIDSKVSPLYKLAWRYDASKYTEDTVLYYLLESQ